MSIWYRLPLLEVVAVPVVADTEVMLRQVTVEQQEAEEQPFTDFHMLFLSISL